MAQKLYEEASIQAIANAIREKNKSEDKYRVSDMAEAIRNISGGISKEEFIQNNADRIASYNSASQYIWLNDNNDTWFMYPCNGKAVASIMFGANTHGFKMSGFLEGATTSAPYRNGQGTAVFDLIGQQYPILNSDLSGWGSWHTFDINSTGTLSNTPFYVYGDTSQVHPYLIKNFGDTLYNMLQKYAKPNDMLRISTAQDLSSYTKGFWCCVRGIYNSIFLGDDTTNVYYDGSIIRTTGTFLVFEETNNIGRAWSSELQQITISSSLSSNPRFTNGNAESTIDVMMYNTEDILNSNNGSVALEANCTIKDFKEMFISN